MGGVRVALRALGFGATVDDIRFRISNWCVTFVPRELLEYSCDRHMVTDNCIE